MHKIQILVVEDEFIVAEDIRRNLEKLGYLVNGVYRTGEDAIAAIKENVPDIVLLDISLQDGMDGIETATMIRKMVHIPFIYITAHSDAATFERAKQTCPNAYIIKPFNFHNLHSAIDLAIYNYSRKAIANPEDLLDARHQSSDKPDQYFFNNAIFIKIGKGFEKVKVDDLCYVKADGSYSQLFTLKREFTLAMNLHTVMERLNRPEVLRVHRSYLVNINCIDRIEESNLKIMGITIPISKALREDLMKRITAL